MKITINKESACALLKYLYNFSGRATRKEFWLTTLGLFVLEVVVLGIVALLGLFGLPIAVVMLPAIFVAAVANLFRRLHDLGLSGFWMCYLSALGLPFLYVAYIMGADESTVKVIERIKAVGTPWLGWILSFVFWPIGSVFGLLLILLSIGQKQDNQFGPNPYAVA